MSGIVGFFQKFMPPSLSTNSTAAVVVDYHTSLLDTTAQPDDDEELEVNDDEVPTYTEDALDYKDWKKVRNQKLMRFFTKRFLDEEEAETTDEESQSEEDDSEEEKDTNDTLDSQEPQTQEPQTEQPPPRLKRKRIPHVDETEEHVTRLEDIDLFTHQATMDLAVVTRVVHKRSTKRYAVTQDVYNPRHLPILGSSKTLPHIPNAPLECDGPLSTIYSKNVLHLEMTQLSTTATTHPGPSSSSPTIHPRMRVYFYDNYATALHQVLQDYDPQQHTLLLRLTHVSAHSVIPFAYHHWQDGQSDTVPYCLCFGSRSKMKTDEGAFSFDNPQLEIRMALRQNASGKTREWKLSKEPEMELVAVEEEEERVLALEYQTWRQVNGVVDEEEKEEEAKANETSAAAADNSTTGSTTAVAQSMVDIELENGSTSADVAAAAANEESANVTMTTEEATMTDIPTAATDTAATARGTEETTNNAITIEKAAENTNTAAADKSTESRTDETSIEKLFDSSTAAETAKKSTPTADQGAEPIGESRTNSSNEKEANSAGVENETATASATTAENRPATAATTTSTTATTRATKARQAEEPPTEEPASKRTKASQKFKYILMDELRSALQEHHARKNQPFPGPLSVVKQNKKASGNCESNLYGLVAGFSAATRTRGGDWKVSVTLLDQSMSDDSAAITLVIFCKDRKQLPALQKAGEVLRLHRVVVQQWGGDMQLRGQRSTGYAVYRGGNNFSADSVVSPGKHSPSEEDGEKFTTLWQWGQQRLTRHPTIKASEQRTVSQMRREDDKGKSSDGTKEPDLIGDFTVMVSAIIPTPPNERSGVMPMGFLRVWDGTGPPLSDRYVMSEPAGRYFDPPSAALVAISKINESREGRPPLPVVERLCGRVTNVIIWEEPHWELITRGGLQIGNFLRLRNVNENWYNEKGLNCLYVSHNSWLTPLPPTTYEVLDLLQNHGHLISHSHPVNPASGVLPLDGRHTAPQSVDSPSSDQSRPTAPNKRKVLYAHSAMNPPSNKRLGVGRPRLGHAAGRPQKGIAQKCSTLKMLMSQNCNSTFKGSALVQATIPSVCSAGETWKLCPKVKGSQKQSYRFALRLHDGSTSLNAIVSNAVGEQFFDLSAKDTCRNGADSAFSVLSCIEERRKWNVEIRSVQMKGKKTKYFLLASISPEER